MEVIIFKDVLSFYLFKILQLMFNTAKGFGDISVSCNYVIMYCSVQVLLNIVLPPNKLNSTRHTWLW